jgi:hypothetical protein
MQGPREQARTTGSGQDRRSGLEAINTAHEDDSSAFHHVTSLLLEVSQLRNSATLRSTVATPSFQHLGNLWESALVNTLEQVEVVRFALPSTLRLITKHPTLRSDLADEQKT